jgi:hypothetical protein
MRGAKSGLVLAIAALASSFEERSYVKAKRDRAAAYEQNRAQNGSI